MLYEADLRRLDPRATLAARVAAGAQPVPAYTVTLVEGVVASRAYLDTALSTYAEGWTLERMPAVDRNILRIAAYELLVARDVPAGVVLAEAVALATSLSTDDSPRFVNGLLARLLSVRDQVAGPAGSPTESAADAPAPPVGSGAAG